MKRIPNMLSIARIFLCLPLLVLTPFTTWFMTLYIMAGVTDMLDGPIARYTKSTSEFGANLDGAADVLFALIVVFRIVPVIGLEWGFIISILLMIGIKFVAALVAYFRHKELVLLHTYANKLTALALFVFPLLYSRLNTNLLLSVLILIAFVAFSEEILINALSSEPQRDLKTIFLLNK